MHITIMYYVNIANTVPFCPLLRTASVPLGPRGCGEISSGVEVGKQEEVQTPVAHNDPAVNLATDNEESALHCLLSTAHSPNIKYSNMHVLVFAFHISTSEGNVDEMNASYQNETKVKV